jgi:hypothetical protein
MKKFILGFLLFFMSLPAISQSYEEREDKLLELVGSFSAAFLYNTYGLIGSISDGYMKDAYSDETLNDLMNAQRKVMDNLATVVTKIIDEKLLKDNADINYLNSAIGIINGLKMQAELLKNYARKRNRDSETAYNLQRQKNWKDISKLMGIEE